MASTFPSKDISQSPTSNTTRHVSQVRRKSNSIRNDDEPKTPHSPNMVASTPIAPRWSLGVLNVPGSIDVPGSVFLMAEHEQPASSPSQLPKSLSHDRKKTADGKIILEPQPDDSQNDPLNWPLWQRDIALASLGMYCMLGGGNTPILAAGFQDVATTYDVSTAQVALTTGLFMMGMGIGAVITSPLAIIFGKRPVYLISALFYIAASIWCAVSPSYHSLVAARVFQGIAIAPTECLPSASISEIFFLHERAFKIGIYTLLLLGGKNLVPLVSAVVIQKYGWRWVFWIVAIVAAFCWILLFFLSPETYWDRTEKSNSHNQSIVSRISHRVHESMRSSTGQHDSPNQNALDLATVDSVELTEDEKRSYTDKRRSKPRLTFVQQLKPFNGRLRKDNFFRTMLRPFVLYTFPAVLWASVVYACSIGWLIVISESVSEIYRNPEHYNFSAMTTGLVYISPFVGGILGSAVAGKLSDLIVRFMAKKNGGLYEPEFRLVMAFPVVISTVMGLMGFGWSAQQHDLWIVPTVFFGIISFGCSLGSTTAITFVVDSYREYAGEALVTLNFSKNIFHGLVFSLFINHWLERSGSKSVFIWLGVIQLILLASTIPMYVFGKRARMWTKRKDFMRHL